MALSSAAALDSPAGPPGKAIQRLSGDVAGFIRNYGPELLQAAPAIALTAVNLAQLGLDPATDAAEEADLTALATDTTTPTTASTATSETGSTAAEAGSGATAEGTGADAAYQSMATRLLRTGCVRARMRLPTEP